MKNLLNLKCEKLHFANFIKKSFTDPSTAITELVHATATDETKTRIEKESEQHWGLELLLGAKLTEEMGLDNEVKKSKNSQNKSNNTTS